MRIITPLAGLAIILFSLGCRESPVSPPETTSGLSSSFDSLVSDADAKWSFIFADDRHAVLTDMHGSADSALLDVRAATGNPEAELLWHASISPDSRFILAPYYSGRTTDTSEVVARLLLLDLHDRSTSDVPTAHAGFSLDWAKDPYWLDEQTFLLPMEKYTAVGGGYHEKTVRFLRKRLMDFNDSAVLSLTCPNPEIMWSSDSSTLLFTSGTRPFIPGPVGAIDIDGEREATNDEADLFEREYRNRGSTSGAPVSVSVDRVVSGSEGWGRYWNENWNREWISIDGKQVRCSDASVEFGLTWDPDIQLLTWYETTEPYQVFYADTKGHYRKWHTGHYWGKIRKAENATRGEAQSASSNEP